MGAFFSCVRITCLVYILLFGWELFGLLILPGFHSLAPIGILGRGVDGGFFSVHPPLPVPANELFDSSPAYAFVFSMLKVTLCACK